MLIIIQLIKTDNQFKRLKKTKQYLKINHRNINCWQNEIKVALSNIAYKNWGSHSMAKNSF